MEQKIKNIFKLAIHFLALIFFIFPGFVRGILYWYFRFIFCQARSEKPLFSANHELDSVVSIFV